MTKRNYSEQLRINVRNLIQSQPNLNQTRKTSLNHYHKKIGTSYNRTQMQGSLLVKSIVVAITNRLRPNICNTTV